MTAGVAALAIGLGLMWVGWRHWRLRRDETISAIEQLILSQTGNDPEPLTNVDWSLKYLQAMLGLAIGGIFTVIGIATVVREWELL